MATTKTEHMEVMHSMCQQEIELLQQNLACFLRESARWRTLIAGGSSAAQSGSDLDGSVSENPFALMAFDGYMSQVSAVVGLARKFNIHLQLNRLDKVLVGIGTGKRDLSMDTFKDFIQWNNLLQEQSAAAAAASTTLHAHNEHDFPSQQQHQCEAIESASRELLVALTATENEPKTCISTSSTTTTTLSVRKVHFAAPPESNATAMDSPPLTPSSSPLRRMHIVKDLSAFCEGYEFAASITYIEDYQRLMFYICQMNNNDLLDLSNMQHLRRIVGLPSSDEIFGVSIDKESIMRAVMKTSSTSAGEAAFDAPPRMLLIDFGEVVTLNEHCELFLIPPRYQRIPAQAIKCVLLGLNEAPNASDEDLPYLGTVLERNEFKRVTFCVVRKVRSVLHVRLFENHPAEKLKAFLVSQKPAKNDVNPFLNSSDEDLAAYYVKDDDAAIPLSALKVSENTNWKRNFESNPNVHISADNDFKVESPKDLRASAATASDTDDQLTTAKTLSPSASNTKLITHAADEDDDSIVKITVTHVAEVDCFYGQIETNGKGLRTPLFWHDDELPPQQKLMALPHLNDLVLAQYIKDEFWYRAQVKEINYEKEIFKVFFVDFGNTETVPLSCLAKCMFTQAKEPFRAIRCRLADVQDITGHDDIRRHQAMQSLFVIILNQSLLVKILQRNEKELLIRIVDQEFADVPQILISMGYAKQI